MIKHKSKIVTAIVVIAILVISFFCGSKISVQHKTDVNTENNSVTHLSGEEKIAAAQEIATQTKEEENIHKNTPQETSQITQNQKTQSEQPSEEFPPPEETVNTDGDMTCSLSIRCDTILDNLQYFDKNKLDIVPKDGKIFENKNAVFYEGESVFNVLMRELKKNKIHFEFTKTPVYNSAYIEGIGNIYEYDCGELSGWLYKVNGKTPGYGCSQYILNNGDVVEFIYSCNLGVDVGGYKDLSGE